MVRFLAIQFRWGGQAIWAYLDAVLQPPAYAVGRILRPGQFLSYTTTLIVLAVLSLVVWFAGGLLFALLGALLHNLPF